MKNMALLIDTNILITFLTKREDPFLEESEKGVLCPNIRRYICFLDSILQEENNER